MKHKKNKMSGLPRSKGSRQKIRRWSFVGERPLPDGQKGIYPLPGVVIGDSAEAQDVAKRLLDQFRSDMNAPQDWIVRPVAHEVVSEFIQKQLRGQSDQINLLSKAGFILAERCRLVLSSDESVDQILGAALDEARKNLFPQMTRALANAEKLNLDVQQAEVVPESAIAEPVEPKPRRKLGIEAVQEALNTPVGE